MTTAGRPALRLINGGLSLNDLGRGAARSAFHIVEVAQQWAALMVESGEAERLLASGSPMAALHFQLLDAVNELEGHAAGVRRPRYEDEGPAITER